MAAVRLQIGMTHVMLLSPLVLPAIAIGAAMAALGLVIAEIAKTVSAVNAMKSSVERNAQSSQEAINRIEARTKAPYSNETRLTALKTLQGLQAGNNASGTDSWRGGPTWVGEKGPELMNLPRGTEIIPNGPSEQMAKGMGGTTINISGTINIQTPEAATAFWDRVDQTARLSRMGMA